MLHTKEISKITYQDIVEFCAQEKRESICLDYKKEISPSLAKTIAAMANTWGGVILIGVDEADSKPKLPVSGIDFENHIPEQISNMILGNVTPPVFPEVAICKSEDSTKAFVVIRIVQSNLTPHAIKGNTKVYLRTENSNKPEELADLERIAWLQKRRKKSVELREGFNRLSEERTSQLITHSPINRSFCELVLSASPLYPYEPLSSPIELKDSVADEILVHGPSKRQFPINTKNVQPLPMQGGIYTFRSTEDMQRFCHDELNHYGHFYQAFTVTNQIEDEESNVTEKLYLDSIIAYLDMFIESMSKYYAKLGYWGMVKIDLELTNLKSVGISNLPAPKGEMWRKDEDKYSVHNTVSINRELSVAKLGDNKTTVISDIFRELSWSLGFTTIGEEQVLTWLKERGRV